jgi:hypothetical protein
MMTKGGCTGKHGRRSGSALSEVLGRTVAGALSWEMPSGPKRRFPPPALPKPEGQPLA